MKSLLTAVELAELQALRDKCNDHTKVLKTPKLAACQVEAKAIELSVPLPSTPELWPTNIQAKIESFRVLTGPTALKPAYAVRMKFRSIAETDKEYFCYEAGDSFGFFPELDKEMTDWLAERLGFDQSAFIQLSSHDRKELEAFMLPSPIVSLTEDAFGLVCRTGELLCRLDFSSLPKKAVIRAFAECVKGPEEEQRWQLLFLSSQQGALAYNRLREEGLSAQMLLAAFPSVCPDLGRLASLLGPLQPRYYSACSAGGDKDVADLEFVFNVTEWRPSGNSDGMQLRRGVASSWLEHKLRNVCGAGYMPLLPRSIKHFRLPGELPSEQPLLMVASGTGVAPFIGFLRSLAARQIRCRAWLIYGFRNGDEYLFKDEIEHYLGDGILNRLSLARSRDPSEAKRYVQDVLAAEAAAVYELVVHSKGLVYICGEELTMVRGVNDALVKILSQCGNMPAGEAESLLTELTRSKRILRDLWI